MHWLSFPRHIQAGGGLAFFDRKGQICRLWLEGERERERVQDRSNRCMEAEEEEEEEPMFVFGVSLSCGWGLRRKCNGGG